MKQLTIAQLVTTLNSESQSLETFIELLKKEQSMLVENVSDQLIALSEQKTTQAIKLNDLAQSRRTLLQKNISSLNVDSINAWLKNNCPDGLIIWQKILVQAENSQQLNQTNGELIQMKLRHNQQSLAVLSSAYNKANLYGPDGQTSFTPSNGRSLGSV